MSKYSDKGDRLDEIEYFRWGYSLYEVDGVFFNHDQAERSKGENWQEDITQEDIKKFGLIFEERTQIIRTIFIPDLDNIQQKVKEKLRKEEKETKMKYYDIRDYVREYLRADMDYEERRVGESEKREYEKVAILDCINKWVIDIGIFIFGYLVFSICEKIESGAELQEEIWVISMWHSSVNKIKIPEHLRKPQQESPTN